MLKRLSVFVGLTLTCLTTVAQITGYEWEIVQVHYEDYGDGQDLTGYVTHRLWVNMTNEDDFLSSVYGTELNVCDDPDASDIMFNFDCNLFQHEITGGVYGEDQGCIFFGLPGFESGPYDSYITIGQECQGETGCDTWQAYLCPNQAVWEDAFEGPINGDYFDGGDLFIDDGAMFNLGPNPCGTAGTDLKVLLAQFTTCGDIDFCLTARCFINGDGALTDDVTLCSIEPNPCTDEPLDPVVTILDDIDCFGELATVQVGDLTGNGDINLELYNVLDPLTPLPQLNDNIFTGLLEGDYYVALEDAVGCRDTSVVFTLVEPDTLEFSADLTADVLCFGDATGEICFTVQGGTEPYNIELLETGETLDADGCFTDLTCGDYTIEINDAGTCFESETFSVNCPEELTLQMATTDVDCNGADNGELNGNVNGGSGDITVTWTYPDDSTVEIVGEDPLDVSITDLAPGEYEFLAVDTNNCQITDLFLITEPTPVITDVTTTDATCFGLCDGTIDVDAVGGTGSLDTECELLGGGPIDPNAVCAGDYVCITTDDNGCMVSDTLTILEPEEITYLIVNNPASCFGECDGSIFVQELLGGSGNIDLSLTPDGTFIDILPDSVGWVDLCPGFYNITFTDLETNCVITETNIEISEPPELVLNITTSDITCFGADDGIIDIGCAGGTGEIMIMSPDTVACPATLTDLAPGTYTIIIEDESGCEVSQDVELTQPDLLVITVTGTQPIGCGGDCDGVATYEVTGGTPDYVILLDGAIIQDVDLITLCAQDDYVLSVIDMNACIDSTTFTIVQPDPIEILIAVDNVTCTGMSDGSANIFGIGGIPPVTLELEDPELDLDQLSEGEYIVFATDSVGCTAQDTIVVLADIITDLQVEVFSTPLTCWNTLDGTATAAVTGGNPPIYFQWDDPAQQTTATAVGLDEDVYDVTITDDIGCTIDTLAIVEPNIGCFFIATAITPNGDGANDEWLIGGLEYFPLSKVQVYNRWGQLLYESIGYSVPWDGRHNGNKLPASDYYFIITYDETEEPITGSVTLKY
jgi:gliding motility-associated-like protein